MKAISVILVLISQHILLAQETPPADKLTAAYTQGRADAIKQVNQRYVQQTEAVIKLSMQARDLEKANAASAWSKRLLDDDDTNDTDGIAPNPTSADRLIALQTSYLKERAEAIARVSRKQSELFVDGKLVCSGPGKDKKVEKVTIHSGDGWSPGSVEVQDLMVLRGTDKVLTP
jgi:hypothetical protein